MRFGISIPNFADPVQLVEVARVADAELRREYEQAGATWLIEGPAPGDDWLDDAMEIVGAGPPTSSV